MMEKRNTADDGAEKSASGDAGDIDDIVSTAARRMAGIRDMNRKRVRTIAREAATGVNEIPAPGTSVC